MSDNTTRDDLNNTGEMLTQYPDVAVSDKQSYKTYKCARCGHEKQIQTNHYGACWSMGRFNTCPDCPPWAKYSEFGGQTVWECMETTPGRSRNK